MDEEYGFWIAEYRWLVCPICDSTFDIDEKERHRFRFCPFCGNRLRFRSD